MPPTSAPAELSRAAVARFARDLTGFGFAADARLLVAVSGGPDSVALLLLAQAALANRCSAATVDHGLRPESDAEARWVGELCAERGIEHAILQEDVPPRAGRTANLSARARDLRYRLLGQHARRIGAAAVATAHHADDQLETLVMRLNRGAGLAGLAGVRARNGDVIRPLLGWRKAELAALVAEHGIVAVDDPSNVSDRFDRARLRKALAGIDWLDADRWTASARALGDAEAAIEWMVEQLEPERCSHDAAGTTLRPHGLPFELQRRLVERCLAQVDPAAAPRGGAIAEAIATLGHGRTTMLGNVLCTPQDDGDIWRFTPAPARRAR